MDPWKRLTRLFPLDTIALPAVAFLGILLLATCWWSEFRNDALRGIQQERERIAQIGRLSAQIRGAAAMAVRNGDEATFLTLQQRTAELQQTIPDADDKTIRDKAAALARNARALADLRTPLTDIAQSIETLRHLLPRLTTTSDRVAESLLEHRSSRRKLYRTLQLTALGERIKRDLNRLTDIASDTPTAVDLFGRDVALYGQILATLEGGDTVHNMDPVTHVQARTALLELTVLYEMMSAQSQALVEDAPALIRGIQTLSSVTVQNDAIQDLVDEQFSAARPGTGTGFAHWIGTLAGVALLAVLLILAVRRQFSPGDRDGPVTGGTLPS